MQEADERAHGPLRPVEMATAAVLAGVSVALTVAGWFLPHLGLIAVFAVVPMGVVAHRHRPRALVAAAFAAAVLSFLVAGTGTVSNIILCAMVGGLVGTARRRGWSFWSVLAGSLVIGPILGLSAVALLYVFGSLRKLTLEQIKNTWTGFKRILGRIPALDGFVNHMNHLVNAALRDWWITVMVLVVVSTVWVAILGWVVLGSVLERLAWIQATDRLDLAPDTTETGPVPVRLVDAEYRYPGAGEDALRGVTLEVRGPEMVALLGDNGSGKSTVARILAGRPPTGGLVERPGSAGLGRPGGTAMIMQHPETQILGVKVADDVVWGLHDDEGVDIEGLLVAVGLGGMGQRETSSLSGGELQRLAVAAALARRPRLLISDESTAMVDREGREMLTELLASLPARRGTAVVHVTHRLEEVAAAGRTYRLAGGRVTGSSENGTVPPSAGPPGESRDIPVDTPKGEADERSQPPDSAALGDEHRLSPSGPASSSTDSGPSMAVPASEDFAPARLELVGVSHTYGIGTPWAQPALHDVDLTIEAGEGVLIVGGNGSGKSTLAWILAGVLRPWRGECLVDGEPSRHQIGRVGLAFQQARLQLQRATVVEDVEAAGAPDRGAAEAALAAVGLDAGGFGDLRVDTLSGGQQRRVALAGILARRPSILVLDEPLAGLDQPSQEVLLGVLAGLRHDLGLTVIVISHDLGGVERVCDRVVHLESGRIRSDEATAVAL